MKSIQKLYKWIFLLLTWLVLGCEKETYEFGDLIPPSNLVVSTEIIGQDADNPYGDGSGAVIFTANASDVITYKFFYDGNEELVPSGKTTINFSTTGIHKYAVTVVAMGAAGNQTSETVEVEVLAEYEPPADLIEMLTGGSSRSWRVKAESAGHMGVGPADADSPIWWAAGPYDKAQTAMYDDEYIFNIDGTVLHSTKGAIFGKAPPLEADFGEIADEPNGDDEHEHYPLDDFTENWTITAPGGQETLNFTGTGFAGFYVGGHTYTILKRSDNEMELRTVGYDTNGWFIILTAEPAVDPDQPDPEYSNLIWQDEFDTDGAPDAANWNYDIGRGDNGWGNGEAQYYTDRADNVIVENGSLKIMAKKENFEGAEYTSARLKTQGKFDFTYGKVEIRAKLAGGGGTWPALWMLGANFETVGWPACGEIDIMEYVGNSPGSVQSAIHNTASSGDTVNKGATSVSNETDEFHTYSVIWSEEQISFYVDDERFYIYRPDVRDQANWPFDASQFLIFNVAMGGSLGGDIDPAFDSSTMEIDYVRVYQ